MVAIKPISGKTAPDYRLQARSIADVQAAVKFATSNNICVVSRFTIKWLSSTNLKQAIVSTGHDYMARLDAASGLLIDVSKMIAVHVL